jgi:hypothetical protein
MHNATPFLADFGRWISCIQLEGSRLIDHYQSWKEVDLELKNHRFKEAGNLGAKLFEDSLSFYNDIWLAPATA